MSSFRSCRGFTFHCFNRIMIHPNLTVLPSTMLQSSTNYINLTPLMVLVAVCSSIFFCCLCLTSFNSWMKNYHESHQPAISYGEAQQENLKFGSIFMTYMPDWWVEKIKSSLYSRYYVVACNRWWDPSVRLSAWATQLQLRNIATVANRWQQCVPFTRPRNRS